MLLVHVNKITVTSIYRCQHEFDLTWLTGWRWRRIKRQHYSYDSLCLKEENLRSTFERFRWIYNWSFSLNNVSSSANDWISPTKNNFDDNVTSNDFIPSDPNATFYFLLNDIGKDRRTIFSNAFQRFIFNCSTRWKQKSKLYL
jgi:hypothetical protein